MHTYLLLVLAMAPAVGAFERGERLDTYDTAAYARLEIDVGGLIGGGTMRIVVGLRAGKPIDQFWIEKPGLAGYLTFGQSGVMRSFVLENGQLTGSLRFRCSGRVAGKDIEATHHYTLSATLQGQQGTGTWQRVLSDIDKKNPPSSLKKEVQGALSLRQLRHADLLATQAIDPMVSWPKWRGPKGSGVQSQGHKLVERWRDARLLWRSEGHFGTFKGSGNPGTWHSGIGETILADGKIYFFHYEGDGKTVKLGCGPRGNRDKVISRRDQYRRALQTNPLSIPQRIRDLGVDGYYDKRYSILADDILECYDAASGARLWRKVFTSQGINSRDLHEHWSPAHVQGRVVFLGSAGRLYCVDAVTGATHWIGNARLGKAHPSADERQTNALHSGNPRGLSIDTCLTIAGDIVYLSGHAFDLETGAHRWSGPAGSCSPQGITLDGKPYVLVWNRGVMHLLQPSDGTVLWSQQGAFDSSQHVTPAVSGSYVFFRGVHKVGKSGLKAIGPRCFRISPDGAELLWTGALAPEPNWPIGAGCSASILDGYVYTVWGGGNKMATAFACFDLQTGNLVGSTKAYTTGKAWQSLVAGDGRVFYCGFTSGPSMLMRATSEPGGFAVLDGPSERGRVTGASWSGATCVSPLYADGRLIYRGSDALYCLDLRQTAE